MRLATVLSLAAVLALTLAIPAHAQQQQPIGVADPSKVFTQLTETKDLQQKLQNELKNLQDEGAKKETELKELQNRRDTYNVGTQLYETANKEWLDKAINYRVWFETM